MKINIKKKCFLAQENHGCSSILSISISSKTLKHMLLKKENKYVNSQILEFGQSPSHFYTFKTFNYEILVNYLVVDLRVLFLTMQESYES